MLVFFISLVKLHHFSNNFVSFCFREMTVSRSTKFREIGHLFREITKFVSLTFREITNSFRFHFAKRNFVGNPTLNRFSTNQDGGPIWQSFNLANEAIAISLD